MNRNNKIVYEVNFKIEEYISNIYEKEIIKNLELSFIEGKTNYYIEDNIQELIIIMTSSKYYNFNEFIDITYKNFIKDFNKRFKFKLYNIIQEDNYSTKTIKFICKKHSSLLSFLKFLSIDKLINFDFKFLKSLSLRFIDKFNNDIYFDNNIFIDTYRNIIEITEIKKDYYGKKLFNSIIKINLSKDKDFKDLSIYFLRDVYLSINTDSIFIHENTEFSKYLDSSYANLLKEKIFNFLSKNLINFIKCKIRLEDKFLRKVKNELSILEVVSLII